MLSLDQIETEIKEAIKAKDQLLVDTLRGLKTRIQNEKIAKMKDLGESEILALVKSEVKKRKEAAESYGIGGRAELQGKELKEAAILEKFLPPQMQESELKALVEKVIAENNFTVKDFGKAMGQLKAQVGEAADGSKLAKLLKEKLK
ncbi:MAG: GatB/YqeY domain-containing protein [Candidatus Doudnabacteria bacterium]|nr:GatB/YqeY domain-containing protein [Candidatus Doudnabacteria bacterium]